MILEFLGNKTGQAGQGQCQCRAELRQLRGRIDRLGFEVGQEHVWQNQDIFKDGFRTSPGHEC